MVPLIDENMVRWLIIGECLRGLRSLYVCVYDNDNDNKRMNQQHSHKHR